MINKWKTIYLKLTLNKDGRERRNNGYKPEYHIKEGGCWGIVALIKPNHWEVIYKGDEEFDRATPFPLDIHYGHSPDLKYYDYEVISEHKTKKLMFIDKL